MRDWHVYDADPFAREQGGKESMHVIELGQQEVEISAKQL